MPQLDISSFPSQLFWLAIIFVAMYAAMAKFAIPAIAEVVQRRRQTVQDDLEVADTMKDKARSLEEEYENAVKKTRADSQAIQQQALEQMKAMAAKRHAELDAELAKKMARADERIHEIRTRAIDELVPLTSDLAQAIGKKLARLKLDKSTAEAAARELIQASVKK